MDDRTIYMFMEITALINLLRGKIVPPPPQKKKKKKKNNDTPAPPLNITAFTLNIRTRSHPLFF